MEEDGRTLKLPTGIASLQTTRVMSGSIQPSPDNRTNNIFHLKHLLLMVGEEGFH
jgi:hypothetical protein